MFVVLMVNYVVRWWEGCPSRLLLAVCLYFAIATPKRNTMLPVLQTTLAVCCIAIKNCFVIVLRADNLFCYPCTELVHKAVFLCNNIVDCDVKVL